MTSINLSAIENLVEAARLPAIHCGAFLVVHELPSQPEEPNGQSVAYNRQRTALGKGTYGEVHLETAMNESHNVPAVRAVKEISKKFCTLHGIEWWRELEAMIMLSHHKDKGPFAAFYGWYENPETVFLTMEYFKHGDLSEYIRTIQEEDEIQKIAQQLAQGLKIMHTGGIVHRDLKPKNIFVAALGPQWSVKIADFGSSKRPSEVTGLKTTYGTIGYMAPEYCSFMRQDSEAPSPTPAVDIWSFGCVIYELFTKECPFREEDRAFRKYCDDAVLPDAFERSFASVDAKHAIEALLHPQPGFRPSAEEALVMTWFAFDADQATTQDDSAQLDLDRLGITSSTVHATHSPHNDATDLRHMASNISLATTATLVNETGSATLRPHAGSSISRPLFPTDTGFDEVPPQLPARSMRAQPQSLPPRISGLSNTPTLPALPPRPGPSSTMLVQSPASKTRKVEDLLIDFDDGCGEDAAGPPGSSLQVLPVTTLVPMRRAEFALQKLPDYDVQLAAEPATDMKPELPPRLPPRPALRPPDTTEEPPIIDPWFVTSLLGQQCDLCHMNHQISGRKRNINAQNKIHLCEDCDQRPLCEFCARQAIIMPGDAHHADHKLREVGPSLSYPFAGFFNNGNVSLSSTCPPEQISPAFCSNWWNSDRAIYAPHHLGSGRIQVRLLLKAPPGSHTVTVNVQVVFDPEKCTSDVIGQYNKNKLKLSKSAWGFVQVGAQPAPSTVDTPFEAPRYMPSNLAEEQIRRNPSKEKTSITLSPKGSISVVPGQYLEVLVRTSYDPAIFKGGSPFKYYIDWINLAQFGECVNLATTGQILLRNQVVKQQTKLEKEMKTERCLRMANSAGNLAGVVMGVSRQGYALAAKVNQSHAQKNQATAHAYEALAHANEAQFYQTAETWTKYEALKEIASDYEQASQAEVPMYASSHHVNAWDNGFSQPSGYSQPLQLTISDPTPTTATFESVESMGADGAGSATYSRWNGLA